MLFFRWIATLALLAVLCGAAVVTENGLPILWEKTSGLLSDRPGSVGIVTLDPWDYSQRMSMYRLLINASDPYMSSMGQGTNQNPLWGLPLQLSWKLRSGRLVDPTGADSCGKEGSDLVCIAPSSWWACKCRDPDDYTQKYNIVQKVYCHDPPARSRDSATSSLWPGVNYHLSVIPFLAALEAGVMGDGLPQVEIQAPADVAKDYCTSINTCSSKHADAMARWVTFFQSLKTLSASDASEDEKKDQILGLMWAAELASLSTASNTCAERQKQYSRPEVSFGESWIGSAQYVAATHFLSSMENSELFMTPLPGRVLLESDKPPNIADLSAEENHTLYVFSWINSANKWFGGSLTTMWQRAMCSQSARKKGHGLLQDVALNPRFALARIFSILGEMISSC